MIICSVNHVQKIFGGHTLFEDLSFQIKENERIGLVGRNGSGKTTVFKLLAGMEQSDRGEIHLKKDLQIGYLAQIPVFPDEMSVYDVLLTAFSHVKEIEAQLNELTQLMSVESDNMDAILGKYGELQQQFEALGGYEVEGKVASVLNGLDIMKLKDQPFSLLSGGEKTKVGLGLILLKNPDILLLDEPTNHLDLGAIEWLAAYLREYKGTIVIITHDRYFLDEVATTIMDLEDGEITVYKTNYSNFVKEKEERLLQEFQSYQEQQKKIKKMKEAIKRLREWANQANPPNEGLHKRANSMEKALNRIEVLKKPVLEAKTIGLKLEAANRSGKDVIVAEHVTKVMDNRVLFEDLSFTLQVGERAVILGQNGTGKTTLLKLFLQEIESDAGTIRLGSNVKVGYLSQQFVMKKPTQTVIDTFREEIAVSEGEARHILAKFLFYGYSVYRQVGQLSGGERMRLRLAIFMYQDINLLVLDEPTNHLDIESREVLEEALEGFKGTILAVSHDRYFINCIFNKIYWLNDQKLTLFLGNYDEVKDKMVVTKEKKERLEKLQPVPVVKQQTSDQQVTALEQQLVVEEEKLQGLLKTMEQEQDLEKLQVYVDQQEQLQGNIEKLYEQLETLL